MAAHQAPPSLGFSRQEHWSGLPFPSPEHESESESEVTQSCPTQWPHGLQPTRLLCPWDFPGKSTGVGSHCLLCFIHLATSNVNLHLALHMQKEMATHSSVLAWRIPGTVEPGGLPSMGLHRVGHDWSNLQQQQLYTTVLLSHLIHD